MSVSFNTLPDTLSAARSPLDLEVSGGNYRTTTPVLAVITITFSNPSAAGDTIQLNTLLGSITLTCSDTPDDTGLQFLSGPGGIAESAQGFAAGALANPFLCEHYAVLQVGAMVVLTAREPSPNTSLLSSTVTPGSLATVSGATAGVAARFATNYGLVVRPRVWFNNAWEAPVEYPLTPDQSSLHASMDLADHLLPYLKPDWPEITQIATGYPHLLSLRPYVIEVFERYGSPVVEQAIAQQGTTEAPFLAWLAGWQRKEVYNWQSFMNRVKGLSGAPHPFLTWRGREARHYVTKREVHHLGWYHWPMLATPEEFQVQARLTHTEPNGTDPVTTDWADRYSIDTAYTIPRERICSIAAGYTQLGLWADLPSGRVAQSYQVRINEAETGPKSEELTFWMARDDFNEKFIWFISSFGVQESLRTTGAWTLTNEHQYMEVRRPRTVADLYDVPNGTRSSEPLGSQARLRIFTGYLPRAEFVAVMDVLGSPGIAEADYVDKRRKPLRFIEGSKVEYNKRGMDGELLYGAELDFAADDPNALTTAIVLSGQIQHNETDALSSGGGGGGPDPGP